MTTHSTTTLSIETLLAEVEHLRAEVAELRYNARLGMLNAGGLASAIRELTPGRYSVVFCDIDKMKALNAATGSHFATDAYLRAGLRVRAGELAGQVFGDEFVFIIDERSRGERLRIYRFIDRIRRQLAAQPLRPHERHALADALGCPVGDARITATFAHLSGLAADEVTGAIETLSGRVLSLKARRDGGAR
jgi:GGDEF domain-containing protein